jgi:hypothetical protein
MRNDARLRFAVPARLLPFHAEGRPFGHLSWTDDLRSRSSFLISGVRDPWRNAVYRIFEGALFILDPLLLGSHPFVV